MAVPFLLTDGPVAAGNEVGSEPGRRVRFSGGLPTLLGRKTRTSRPRPPSRESGLPQGASRMQGETIHTVKRFPLVTTLLLAVVGGLLATALARRSYNYALGAVG